MRNIDKNRSFLILILLSVLSNPLVQIARADIGLATAYLKAQSDNPWVTMALSAVGESGNTEYLKSVNGSSAIELAAPILAITTIGEDPRIFSDNNLIEELKTYYSGGQIGDASTLNDDIFGLLALLSAGEPVEEGVVLGAKDHILENQNPDGGWGFMVGGSSDTNTTAAAIMTFIEYGASSDDPVITSAVDYLKSAQNLDGGFPYDPLSPWGTDSDGSSDAWVISAIEAIEGSLTDWSVEGVSPIGHLLSLQAEGGYFQYQNETGEDAFTPITTSYAVIALAGKGYPIGTISYIPPDVTAPTITLVGDSSIDIEVSGNFVEFVEPGYTASDDVDGDITSLVVKGGEVVDVSTIGTYTVTYNVSDLSGNPAREVFRTVTVNEKEEVISRSSGGSRTRSSNNNEDEESADEKSASDDVKDGVELDLKELSNALFRINEGIRMLKEQNDKAVYPELVGGTEKKDNDNSLSDTAQDQENFSASIKNSTSGTEVPSLFKLFLLLGLVGLLWFGVRKYSKFY